MNLLRTFLLFLALPLCDATVTLQGFLDEQSLEKASEQMVPGEPVVLLLQSKAGELAPTLAFAQKLRAHPEKVTLYIHKYAVGPAALLPFTADELFVSPFAAWGDIAPTEEYPVNLLKAQVQGLIKNSSLLAETMALGMLDEQLLIVDQQGLKSFYRAAPEKSPILAPKGERLILGTKLLKRYELIEGAMPYEAFLQKFSIDGKAAVSSSSLEAARFAEAISFSAEGPNRIGHIYIGDQKKAINQGTWLYVKQALEYYQKKKPIFILLELNTPGGEVYAAQKISDALKEMDSDFNIPVVTVINNWAISAGAMLAYSTRFIVPTKAAAMGAAEPVYQTSEGMKSASEKVNSALRTDFANRAGFFDRNPLIAEAMVDKDLLLVRRAGRIVQLSENSEIKRSDEVITRKGKLLTLNAKEMMQWGVGDLLLEKGGKNVKTLLLQEPFFKTIPNVAIDSYQPDWKTTLLTFLAAPAVASMLLMGVMVGFYVEFNTPGFGIPGGIAVCCLALVLLSSFTIDAVQWFEVILMGIGLLLLLLDLFVIPSFGIVGTLGALMLVVGLVAALIPGIESIDYDFVKGDWSPAGAFALKRLAWISGGVLAGIGLIGVLSKTVIPFISPYNRFVLRGAEQEASRGFVAGIAAKNLPERGATGEAVTDLRMAGFVEIAGKRFPASSDSGYIDKGTSIVVTRKEGNVLFVEES